MNLQDSIAIASAGLGALNTTLNTAVGSRKQYKYTHALMEEQYQHQLDFWNMNNEYNSPSAQMQRYADAGVNPYVALGSSNTSNYGSVMQPVPTPPNPMPDLMAGASAGLDLLMKRAQIDNVKANTDLTEEKTLTQEAITKMQPVIERLNKAGVNLREQEYEIKELRKLPEFQYLLAQYNNLNAKTGETIANTSLIGEKVTLTREQVEQVKAATDELKSRLKLNDAKIKALLSTALLNGVNARLGDTRLQYADDFYKAESSLMGSRAISAFSEAEIDSKTVKERISEICSKATVAGKEAGYLLDDRLEIQLLGVLMQIFK